MNLINVSSSVFCWVSEVRNGQTPSKTTVLRISEIKVKISEEGLQPVETGSRGQAFVLPPSSHPDIISGGSVDAGAQPHQSALEGGAAPAQESGRAGAENTLDSHGDGSLIKQFFFGAKAFFLFVVCAADCGLDPDMSI